jgi:hypothetical protein
MNYISINRLLSESYKDEILNLIETKINIFGSNFHK